MTESTAIDPKHTAILVMDYQAGVVAAFPQTEPMLARASALLDAARAAKLPVIYIVVEFRPGHPEINAHNAALAARIKQTGRLIAGSSEVKVASAVAPRDGDITVVKRRIGAFSGTELDLVLRSLGVDTLILFGIATNGVVLTTVRQAFDLDYRQILVEDCCADADAELHTTLMTKVLGRQAQLIKADELAAQLRAV